MKALRMEHTVDPRKTIYDKVGMKKLGEIPGYALHGNRVLVAIYERPEKTASGLHLPQTYRAEDEHQGKAAVVLLKGHSAFKSDDNFDFGPDNVEPGDWVQVHVTDGRKCNIYGQLCRVVRDQDIIAKIPAPDAIY
jgi:co-chaperonin GroES (HSP10)